MRPPCTPAGFFLAKYRITQVFQPLLPTAQIWLPGASGFPKAKIAVESDEICECDCHTVHELSQRRLTADWLAQRESDCSRIRNTVSSDWLPSYVKATWPVLEIFLKRLDTFRTGHVKPLIYKMGHDDLTLDMLNTECRGTSCRTVSKELKRNEGMHGRKCTRNFLTDFWSLESENTYEHLFLRRDFMHATNMRSRTVRIWKLVSTRSHIIWKTHMDFFP